MTRIEQEKLTLSQMLQIYCHGNHHVGNNCHDNILCHECSSLQDYAFARLDHCKFGEKKPTCKACTIHCYKKDMREKMCEVMRYAGPRMILHHPIAAIKHIIREL